MNRLVENAYKNKLKCTTVEYLIEMFAGIRFRLLVENIYLNVTIFK